MLPAEERARQVIKLYASGHWLVDALKEAGLSSSYFCDLRHKHPSLDAEYQRAREARADQYADEIPRIADDEIDPNKARIRVDARKWAAGVLNRQVYGDKVDLTVNKGVDLGSVLTEVQRRRLRLDSDTANIEDAQVIDIQTLPSPAPADTESEGIDPFED